jgi:diaminohydroxyphosphoribosylaminopyrimidine deaminase/5-amino-6-(5-phosphoribosylamino)uracil reductase
MNSSVYMQKALQLAKLGCKDVAPNPMVGCVIIRNDKVIAEGYHKKFGEAHAEVNAINSLGAGFDFSDCTLVVNLEPCSHHGKTPPCSNLIIEKKFRKVIIANTDPNPLVSGKGIEKLKKAGIEIESGILEKEGYELNKRFFTFHTKKRPYIILKWAQTNDGFISKDPLPKNKQENWISGEESKKLSHEWRAEEQAIMIGTTTASSDDPELTVRLVKGKNPLRIVLDKDLKLDPQLNIFNDAAETLVFTGHSKARHKNIGYCRIDFSYDVLKQVLAELHHLNILSIIVEGGSTLLQNFISEDLWDEARVIVNPHKNFGKGIKAPEFDLSNASNERSGSDHLYTIKNPH